MKISKADLISLIHEVIDEQLSEDTDKFTSAINTIDKQITDLNVKVGRLKLQKAKVKLAKASDVRTAAEERLDAAERRGEDVSEEDDSYNTAAEAEKQARDGVSAADNNLKAVQKGGATN